MSTETKIDFDSFITKYYNNFGEMCPFKKTDFLSDQKQLLEQFKPMLMDDIELLNRFFSTDFRSLYENVNTMFTTEEIDRLKYLDKYWDIPSVNFMLTEEGRNLYCKGEIACFFLDLLFARTDTK